MGYNKGFAYAYGWNAYYQKILSACSVKGEGLVARQRAWIVAFVIYTTVWIPQVLSVPLLWGELNAIINCLSTNLSLFIGILKLVVLQYQRRVIGSILVTIADDWTKVNTQEELDAMMQAARISHLSSKISFCFTTFSYTVLVLTQLWIGVFTERDPNLHPRMGHGFLFESYFPFDTTRAVVYVPIWLIQVCSAYVAAMAYSGSDCFVAMAVLHLCGQLRIVHNSFKTIVNEVTLRESKSYWQRLGAIVMKHEQINQRAYILNATFSSLLLIQMLVYSVTFCFQGYSMLMNIKDGSVPNISFNIVYIGFTVLHLFVYCYVGDKLFTESISISDGFYKTDWYNLRSREAISFINICHRASSPLELTAGKFYTFNMQLFSATIKSAMGYLSMLMAMRDKV